MLREKPTTESAIINRLDRGKYVRVIKSYNNWSFVEVSLDNSEEIQTGWVDNRFLAKPR